MMRLTLEQQTILDIFKACEIEEGEYLSCKTLEKQKADLPYHTHASWDSAIRDLIRSGYVLYHPLGYGLSGKALRHICSGHRDETAAPVT